VRGEHWEVLLGYEANAGSSPRARGTHAAGPLRRRGRRFIPACAGNTSPARRPRCQTPVHPRVRGEHSAPVNQPLLASGSSPRARGTLSGSLGRMSVARFIPACAGNTDRSKKAKRI